MNETVKVIQSHNVPLVCSVFIIADFTINLRSRQVEVTTPSGMRQLLVSGFTAELQSPGLFLPGNHQNLNVTLKRLENTTGSGFFPH